MDVYDLFGACESVASFLDTLTNWYIRRSRDRFWEGDQDAIDTLHTALVTLCQVAAPLLPLVSDHVYGGLVGDRGRPRQRAPDRLAERRAVPVRRRICTPAWRRSAMPFDAVVAPQGARVSGSVSRSPRRWWRPRRRLLAAHIDILRDELNVKDVELDDGGRPLRFARNSCSTRRPSGRASAGGCSRSSRPTRPATGRSTEIGPMVGGVELAAGRVRLPARVGGGRSGRDPEVFRWARRARYRA